METDLEVLLTNDDGIDSPGFRALYDALSAVANVTAVAPASDQSAVGRSMSSEVGIEEHELGFAIAGTPADCVVAGLEALGPSTDLVVSGCNTGANLGAYVLGRSGTVSAAVEAAFCGIPAIAVSLHVPQDEWPRTPAVEEYAEAGRAARYLVERAPTRGVFEHAEYLNVNVPLPADDPAPMAITRPSTVYEMGATQDGDSITLHDLSWEAMSEGTIDDPEGTDRRAVMEGKVSVSPLTAPHTTERHEALDRLAAEY
ncbi:5'/3'-nucleotidase SurE [Halalkalicoccus jeotgali]|uniref:5'-nucleotidase SurE n=1 Tax=Halalkalicoccus jeotgali (strain DSM 18796 / CECT 7217 / JCM 14584 / KCTC 4019 / B3) TaxID=795797 RepID=D8J2N7_HALJB|nr:5'/3'-nucleotidase SurE [Halalkalicoccus jeotgali]ADJ14994.1 stationary-phase survival protein SurE [Halalkalicoccus jeotgali B3]ELY34990.1 stationary-phase survival protein SurE [Halalkalicoccus jeotgali B3]